jgi:acyl-CoA synthetase (AMP-forming)/AMP-acid ligase II
MSDHVEVPNWGTIGRMLADNAGEYAHRVGVVDGNHELTYAELHTHARALAKALVAAGVKRGDLVAAWAPNGWRWVVMVHAVWLVGGAIVPISSRLKVLEAGPILERTGAQVLFTVAECAGIHFIDSLHATYGRDLGRLPTLRHLIRLDLEHGPNGFDSFVETGSRVTDADLDAIIAAVQPGDTSEVIFTSGTTGAPKGVQLDHQQLLRAYWDWSGTGSLNSLDNYLVITPFSHGFGLNAGIIASALRGMSMVLLEIFEPSRALELIRRYGISVMGGPPNLYARLMDQPSVVDDPPKTLRVAFMGAASVPAEILRRARSVLGVKRAINAYGLMEACVVSMTRAEDDEIVISTSTGRVMPGMEVKIVDDDGQDVPAGTAGEILTRGYGVMLGYWHDAAQTEASMEPGGWFHTGDVGVRDAAGNITIVDRKKDMFICGGFNAYPAEIEDLLLKMGPISAVSVVGIPDAARGEVGVAFVVPSTGKTISEEDVVGWAKQNLAGYKVPRRVFIRDALPLNGNGKVMKDVLRREATAGVVANASL